MNKTRLLLIIAIVLLLGAGLLAMLLTRPGVSRPVVSPTPTPSLDPFSADRKLLKQLSSDFAVKFFTYAKPSDPSYLDSIKPYMTDGFFQQTAQLNARYANIPGGVPSFRSELASSEVKNVSETEAAVTVRLNTREDTTAYVQVVEVRWVKNGDRWSADYVKVVSSTKQ